MATPYDFARGSAMMGSSFANQFANQQPQYTRELRPTQQQYTREMPRPTQQQYTREMPRPTQDRWSGNWGTGASQNSFAPAQMGTSSGAPTGGNPAQIGWPRREGQTWATRPVPRDRVGYSQGYQGPLSGGQGSGFRNPYSRPSTGQPPPQYSPYGGGGGWNGLPGGGGGGGSSAGVTQADFGGFLAGNSPSGFMNEAMRPNLKSLYENTLPWYVAQQNQAQNQISNNQWDQTFDWQRQGDQFNMGETQRMNDFSQWMGGEQMNLAYGDQRLNEWNLGNQHQAAMAGIDLGYYGADQNYNLGMQQTQNQFDLGMANVGLGYYGADQQYNLGMTNADINKMNYQNQFELGMRNAGITEQNYQNQYSLGMTNADINRLNVEGQLGLGQGQLDWQRYNTDTTAGLTREQMANDFFLGKGNLDLQGELGRGALGVQQGDLALRGELGRGELALSQELGRGNLDLQRQLGLGQLGVSQGELALSGELGRGDLGLRTSQQSLDEAYRRSALQQQAELERESLQNQLTQSRYAAFGRAQAPNIRMNRSW